MKDLYMRTRSVVQVLGVMGLVTNEGDYVIW